MYIIKNLFGNILQLSKDKNIEIKCNCNVYEISDDDIIEINRLINDYYKLKIQVMNNEFRY